MKKTKVSLIILIIILINCCIMQSTSYAICNTYVSPSANKQINAIRLTLSDGTVLHDIRITRNIEKGAVAKREAYKKFNLTILIDTSESMSRYLGTVKDSLRDFINKYYTFYGEKNKEKIKIGIIAFNNDVNLEEDDGQGRSLNLTKNTYGAAISGIRTNNTNRDFEQAVDIATGTYENYDNTTKLQTLLIITDGITVSEEEEEYKRMYSNSKIKLRDIVDGSIMASMYAINIEDWDKTMFNNILNDVYGLRYFDTMSYDFRDFLINGTKNYPQLGEVIGIYNEIKEKLINIEHVVPVGLTGDVSMTNETVYLYVDSELINGATLEIEYIMNFSPGTNSPMPTTIVEQIDPNLNFRKDAKLLTEPNATNASKGWYWGVANGKETAINNRAGTQTKIVLTTTLTVDTIPDNGYVNIAFVGGIGTRSMVTKILPPFGENDATADLIRIIALLVAILLVLVLYKIYRRKK